ncbi:MAG: hypothetical protein AAB542_01165 [Patescibacteria group bacterium]
MERQKKARNPLTLFIGVTTLIVTAAYINVFPPDSLMVLLGFFALLMISSTTLGIYLFPHTRHAILISSGLAVYLMLRLIGLRHPLYTLLLVASIAALEYLWRENY